MILLLALACGPSDPKDDSGTTGSTSDPTEACGTLAPGTRLDLAQGCADGLCGGTVYPDAVAVLGAPDGCASDGVRATCTWGDLTADFPDCDGDGAPDEEPLCDQFDQTITVTSPWDGRDPAGLGPGVDAACWEGALGGPGPWTYGENPWVEVSIAPDAGAVETVTLRWSFDE